jgi:hypothetical protein
MGNDAKPYCPVGEDGAVGWKLSAAAVVFGRYLWIASTVCVGNAKIRKAEAITPIATPIAIFNIRASQAEQFQDRFVNEMADDGKTSFLVASELPFVAVGLMRLGFAHCGRRLMLNDCLRQLCASLTRQRRGGRENKCSLFTTARPWLVPRQALCKDCVSLTHGAAT